MARFNKRIHKRKVMGKKSQAALEYVHTYGWIILSMMMLGGVVLYFNVSRAQHLVPLECTFLSGMQCLDASTDENLLSLVVVNGFGFAMGNVSINVIGTCNSTANTTDGNPYNNLNVLLENQQTTYVLECQNLTNMRITERIYVDYVNVETGQQHIKVGKLEYSPTG